MVSQTVIRNDSILEDVERPTGHLFLTLLLEHVGQVALAAVLAVKVLGHEDTSATLLSGALTTHAGHLVGVTHTVVLEHMKLHLLLTLLTSSTETEHKVKGGLLLDVVVLKGAAILELLASEDETLLVRGDALLVLDLGLDGL